MEVGSDMKGIMEALRGLDLNKISTVIGMLSGLKSAGSKPTNIKTQSAEQEKSPQEAAGYIESLVRTDNV